MADNDFQEITAITALGLPKDFNAKLESLASHKGFSEGELIRRYIEEEIEGEDEGEGNMVSFDEMVSGLLRET